MIKHKLLLSIIKNIIKYIRNIVIRDRLSQETINASDTYPQWLSKMFKVNQSLLHVDLSHNEISLKDGEIIKEGLDDNHVLLGLHLTGNEVNTNSEGFIVPNLKEHPESDSHIMTRLTDSLMMGVWSSQLNVELRATSNWWIWEGWSEVKFMFDLNTSDIKITPEHGEIKGVSIHLDFDDYEPDVMKQSSKDPSLYYIVRMVPPK